MKVNYKRIIFTIVFESIVALGIDILYLWFCQYRNTKTSIVLLIIISIINILLFSLIIFKEKNIIKKIVLIIVQAVSPVAIATIVFEAKNGILDVILILYVLLVIYINFFHDKNKDSNYLKTILKSYKATMLTVCIVGVTIIVGIGVGTGIGVYKQKRRPFSDCNFVRSTDNTRTKS